MKILRWFRHKILCLRSYHDWIVDQYVFADPVKDGVPADGQWHSVSFYREAKAHCHWCGLVRIDGGTLSYRARRQTHANETR